MTAATPNWHPIETAPKDGRYILVVNMCADEPVVGMDDDEKNKRGPWIVYWYAYFGWVVMNPSCNCCYESKTWQDWTHWMALPPLPTKDI